MDSTLTPTSIRLVQILAITTAAIAAGSNIISSAATVPALLVSPGPLLARQWKILFDKGLVVVVSNVAVSSAAFAYLAYDARAPSLSGLQSRLFVGAAVAAVASAPYTKVVMGGVNSRLIEIAVGLEAADQRAKVDEGEVRGLVGAWSRLNAVRSVLPLTAAVIGIWAIGSAR